MPIVIAYNYFNHYYSHYCNHAPFVMNKTVLKEGTGLNKPADRSSATVELTGRYSINLDNVPVPIQQLTLTLGEANDEGTYQLERFIATMRTGERSEFTGVFSLPGPPVVVQSELGESPIALKYTIQLVSFQRAKDSWKLGFEEKLSIANHHKSIGNERFREGQYCAAARRYSKALKYIISINPNCVSDGEIEMVYDLKKSCLSNLAVCQLNLKLYDYVVKNCSKVLSMEPNHVKALFRRGKSYMYMGDNESARKDLERAKELDKNNRSVIELLKELTSREIQEKRHYHQALKKMFASSS